jgi:hypothetical protein
MAGARFFRGRNVRHTYAPKTLILDICLPNGQNPLNGPN